MKLIEKLSDQAWQKYIEEKACCPEHLAKATYEAGFRKAREMAEKLHHDGRHSTGMCGVCTDDGEWGFEEMVRNMGEEEV